jgi:hypothetical protein
VLTGSEAVGYANVQPQMSPVLEQPFQPLQQQGWNPPNARLSSFPSEAENEIGYLGNRAHHSGYAPRYLKFIGARADRLLSFLASALQSVKSVENRGPEGIQNIQRVCNVASYIREDFQQAMYQIDVPWQTVEDGNTLLEMQQLVDGNAFFDTRAENFYSNLTTA